MADRWLVVLALSLTPWLLVPLLASGIETAAVFFVAAAVFGGIGFPISRVTLKRFGEAALVAMAVGIVVANAISLMAVRYGFNLSHVFWGEAALSLPGLAWLGREGWMRKGEAVTHGLAFIVVSLLVAAVYVVPAAFRDGVRSDDGSVSWMYVDNSFTNAVAGVIKSGVAPPERPSLPVPLVYHYGPYATSAAFSVATTVEIQDVMVRAVKPAATLALLGAAIGLGLVLKRLLGLGELAGPFAAGGLFFLGSFGSLFATITDSSGWRSGVCLWPVPFMGLPDGHFVQLLTGHSLLWGSVGLVAGLVLVLGDGGMRRASQGLGWTVPGLAVCSNLFAGLMIVGAAAASWILRAPRRLISYAAAAVTVGTAAGCLLAMGVLSSTVGTVSLNRDILGTADSLFRIIVFGWGVRIYVLHVIFAGSSRVVRLALTLLVSGGVAIYLVFDAVGSNQVYGMTLLNPIVSLVVLSALAAPIGALVKGDEVPLTRTGVEVLRALVAVVLAFLGIYLLKVVVGLWQNGRLEFMPWSSVVLLPALAAGGAALLRLGKTRYRVQQLCGRVFMGTVGLSLLAPLPALIYYGLNGLGTEITVSPGEVDGLLALRAASQPGERVATNQHALPIRLRPERSYVYSALSERQMLLEGWRYGESLEPVYAEARADNEALFATTSPEEARRIAGKWRVRYLVLRPDTALGFDASSVPWMSRISNTGTLTVWKLAWSEGAVGGPPR